MKKRFLVAALGLCSLVTSSPALAQLSRLGDTFSVWSDTSRGSAVAYDYKNHVYLVVSAHGRVNARFVNADGAVLGTPFVLQAAVGFGQFPQVAYSPDAHGGGGAFLVTWHESDGLVPSIHTRLVSYTAGLLTPDRAIVGNDTYHEIMGAPVAYSTVSKEFLVVWRQYSDTNVFGIRLNTNGDVISGAIPVATSGIFESDPSLTYNPAADEFFVVYRRGFNPTSVMGQRVKAGTGALVGPPSTLSQAATVNTTGVTYNPVTGQYLAAWHQMPGDQIVGRIVSADGTPIGNANALSTRVGTYDSLSVDTNEISGTVLLVGHDKFSVEVGGVEIGGSGTPLAAGGPVTLSGGAGNHVPKVTSNPVRREWMVSTARNFSQTVAQRVATASTTGGGGGGGGPLPPNPIMSVDYPAHNSQVSPTFGIAGWAVDTGASAGTGVDGIHVWAFPTSGGNAIFLGTGNLGVARPDVGAYLSNARFSSSGFGLTASLAAGTYDLMVFAHSTVTGTFNNAKTVRVTVVAAASNPKMYIDLPAFNQNVARTFFIGGWAVDLGSATGAGVAVVHAWAYPVAGGSPTFVGAAVVGGNRPDVGAYFGHSRFSASGYGLSGTLQPGEYNLVVYAFSTVTNSFNQAALVRIRVL